MDDLQQLSDYLDQEEPIKADAASSKTRPEIDSLPLFQRLFVDALDAVLHEEDRAVLHDFARYTVGPTSDWLGAAPAKGGNFFHEREAEGRQGTQRYRLDQSLRAHLINGMLPTFRIARHLTEWGVRRFRHWDAVAQRLFIAGFQLHDFMKLPRVKEALIINGFSEHEPPSEALMPVLESIFREWCGALGLDLFLEPIGGSERYLHDLIYIACNTQRLWNTARNLALFPRLTAPDRTRDLVTELSRLADLLAYIAPNPRALVSHPTIREAMKALSADLSAQTTLARLTYHHVAENRGLLLNFIHDAALNALTIEGQRIPLLFAPSGVVYLEHVNAPPLPPFESMVERTVDKIRQVCAEQLIGKGKGAKRGAVGLQTDEVYRDFFDLPEYLIRSTKLVERYVGNNKSPDRLDTLVQKSLPGAENLPYISQDGKDVRVDRLAEWAALIEREIRDRLGEDSAEQYVEWLIDQLGLSDLAEEFHALRQHPVARQGGIFYWWFWLAAHYVARHPTMSNEDMIEWIEELAGGLATILPDPPPLGAAANTVLWHDLAHYVASVLTIHAEQLRPSLPDELSGYMEGKVPRRGQKLCALCGSVYQPREQLETAVAFQPGVYTSRLGIGGSANKRQMCSICALEQLLRQLFLDNMDNGGKVEAQRVRFLTLYPTYFFTPETLLMAQRVYMRLKQFRIRDLQSAMQQYDLADPQFWQRSQPFLLEPDIDAPQNRRILRYAKSAPATFLMIGFRNFDDPTDTESWIIPAFLALVLPLCLDVKVVASESSIPLLLEADEMPETVWMDGGHPSIRALLDGARYKIAAKSPQPLLARLGSSDRINVDEIGESLAWLAAAYLIHLETNADRSENWQQFATIAHALAESPLYVFHFLKRQERADKPLGSSKVSRYLTYADLFTTPQGVDSMSHARNLVMLYRGFYRAKNFRNSNSILRPLSVVSDALLTASPRLFSNADALVEAAYGELFRFMDRVGTGAADGRFPKGISAAERQEHMRAFCEYFVQQIFMGVFNCDVSALRGKQLNLLRSACEVIYRDEQSREWAANEDSDEMSEAGEA